MRWSRCYIPTLKEAPSDAEVVSHKLLVRAGMIRKLTSGIYTFMPMGLRALNKVAAIVREEMNRAGAQEVLMPMVQPADLWQETGRWEFYGKELLRFRDRNDRDYCLGPTHEEVITDLVRGEVRSYRQLPINLYQIQTKFRDEIRPRFGLMRGREFVMKDAYSFDRDQSGCDESYKAMYAAYQRIFSRLGLRFRAVEADSGSIGGSFSHEFMVLADTGEDTLAVCTACEYAANVERAEVTGTPCTRPAAAALAEVPTPGAHTIEEVSAFLGVPADMLVKTLLFVADGEPVAALVRGDRELNEVKLKNLLGADSLELATPEQVEAWTGAPVGFAGPVGLHGVKRVFADTELKGDAGWIVGANKADTHLREVSLTRDAAIEAYADLRMITASDPCPRCGGAVELPKGIEVGHVFKLGLKYSKSMNATFLDENGKEQVMVMGCYGIGVSRVVASCIEQNNDGDGIVFPPPIAPYEVALLLLDPKNEEAAAKAAEIESFLEAEGHDVLLDDRDERPGVKFKDADLIGSPYQLVLGGKGLARGVVEAKNRRSGEKTELPVEGFAEAFRDWRAGVLKGWGL
ncbi:proline--tRNA ligase [Nitratidesulfovibrio vulgaris]|uniref:Proline--tRNA ligase n=1 Tax=Nitratidesulfovibrio vulgaris (strain ATCC 29579 / DSM 644 / CCUG 34227 / NCIMB 8303 / VKM B-1760 / Hildenborough) TaxID=882 RepID=SYP_NITV2|nr:proline--tRNA ligase [Nitratidesulfovibrio vulgaris]Q72CD8.1 RecName: Full=Proline--tRNA ligase; AltName: Full=Prolyl-tRNA synthetase; Short=ProRS [Nitratidesulfovibrio vulgaris str. Hildenborough]AAS95823.1 prolyl-tRNA synthetase [Nitratidesulfovibrio vulgaris str. Hildenborough]ADP86401.1 prolyl-tRNA synthetase [Nitratidesulfovibrio vulgaris RCH1]